jgi:O-antigen ligase
MKRQAGSTLRWVKVLLWTSTVGVTVIVNPFTGYDPINLVKMLVLVTASLALIPYLFVFAHTLNRLGRILLSLGLLMISGMLLALFSSQIPIAQQFWGTWGRSTGVLTYFSLLVLLFSVAIFVIQNSDINYLLNWFQKTSYFITIYVLIQYADLDPINWSQKLPFATLGNINFMSSFLGFATCLMISKAVFLSIPLSTRAFFLIVTVLNFVLILATGSIQGLGIIIVGIVLTSFIRLWERYGKYVAISFVTLLSFLGILVSLGVAGFGPIGKWLVQTTVLYRIDYWGSGYRMFLDNPFLGVGVDSYGDFYREYRDLMAVERTGSGRISNTAHNVFLDVLSGSGAVAGLSFIAIYLGISFLILRLSIRDIHSVEAKLLSPLIISSSVFLLVSINQIGVAVWVFLFLGIALGVLVLNGNAEFLNNSNPKRNLKTNRVLSKDSSQKLSKGPLPIFIASISLACVGFFASLPPNVTDSQFLAAYKESDIGKMSTIVRQPGANLFHQEKYLEFIVQKGPEEGALEAARDLFKENPRSFFAAQVIYFSKLTSPAEKQEMARILVALDPNNEQVLGG